MTRRPVDTSNDPKQVKAPPRQERLAAALRANLQKRKAQLRARRGGSEDARSDGTLTPDGRDSA